MEILRPLDVPLHGSTLIEASAGTGKTYTITTLFLRLLLEKRATVDQILVVTFTVAATEELRIKLSDRILEALNWLKRPKDSDRGDEVLAAVLEKHDAQEALQLLSDVAARLDDLAVYTIDAMCLRVLQDFAFESGLPMRMDFIANNSDIRTLVSEDYWRRVVGGTDAFAIEELTSSFKSPASLLDKLDSVLGSSRTATLPQVDEAWLEDRLRYLRRRFFRIASAWEEDAESVKDILRHSKSISGSKYKPGSITQIIQELDSWTTMERLPSAICDKFKLVTETYLAGSINKNKQKPEHSFFDLCDGFDQDFHNYISSRKAFVLIAARDYCQRAVEEYKSNRGMLHFEDLRIRLDVALQGPSAKVLATKIRAMWPYALIDEFQDTDPQQNNIFQTIYSQREDCGFFQIGDPKQAIYSFRGADVFTYMDAARNVANLYTLGTNWRSASGLVTGVNSLFQYCRKPFIFDDHIQFHPVDAAGKADKAPLRIDQAPVTPLQLRMLPAGDDDKPLSAADALKMAAVGCASDIAGLLKKGQSNSAMLGDKPLRAADIAVLVRGHQEGRAMREALYLAGVKSVSLNSETVFNTDQAMELAIVLAAVVQPGKQGLIRRALVTQMIGYDAHQIESLNSDEKQWDELFSKFLSYRELWIVKGFMAALQTLIVELQVAKQLLAYPDGERRMTNLLQLVELLQVKSRELSSHDELLVWLDQQTYSFPDEDRMLRLESDESLVQIVTIHTSKGLEYPVVYIPFPWKISEPKRKGEQIVLFHDRSTYRSIADFGSAQLDEHKLLQKEEQLAENIRLLYVAVTRAQHLCVLCWGNVNGAEKSALGYLLHQSETAENTVPVSRMKSLGTQQIEDDVCLLVATAADAIAMMPLTNSREYFQTETDQATLECRKFNGRIDRHWRITSYSGLLSGEDSGLPDRDEVSSNEPIDDTDEQAVNDDSLGEIAELPAGARTGNMLHDLLEHLDFTNPAMLSDHVLETLKRYGNLGRRGSVQQVDWAPVVEQLINNTLDTVLDVNNGLSLRTLSNSDRLNELGFFFTINGVNSKMLNAVLSESTRYNDTAGGLTFSALNGLMRGYIDMVGRCDGRYYIIDYKSNLLGDTRRFYNRDSMRKTIKSHRYDLQYLIYTVALHRYLKTRILDYQYERDFGGVYYLFVRGMQPGSDAGVWHDRPSLQTIQALDNCLDSRLQDVL